MLKPNQLLDDRELVFEKKRFIVRALTSFHFNVFLKRSDMLNQCIVLSITKKHISHSLVLGQQTLIALQIQSFH